MDFKLKIYFKAPLNVVILVRVYSLFLDILPTMDSVYLCRKK